MQNIQLCFFSFENMLLDTWYQTHFFCIMSCFVSYWFVTDNVVLWLFEDFMGYSKFNEVETLVKSVTIFCQFFFFLLICYYKWDWLIFFINFCCWFPWNKNIKFVQAIPNVIFFYKKKMRIVFDWNAFLL